MDPQVPVLLQEIDSLGKAVTQAGYDPHSPVQRELLAATRKLSMALQNPGQLVDGVLWSNDDILYKIGCDLGIFKLIVASAQPLTLTHLTKATNADPILLGRIMRGLASIYAVEDLGGESYGPTKLTHGFASTKGIAGINMFYDLVRPGMNSTPDFLAQTGYKNPTDPKRLPFNLRYGDQLFFEYLVENPKALESFNQFMTAQREGHTSWLDYFPIEDKLRTGFDQSNGVMFVDMGGGVGHEVQEVKRLYPSLPGRMILQDLPVTIDRAPNIDGMEAMKHDFFTPQPIKGARAYYLRSVLHDWDDQKCRVILSHIRDAMTPGYSKILINDFVIPLTNPDAHGCRLDIMVMALAGATERTVPQWHELVQSVGLKVDKIWSNDPRSEGLIEVSLDSQ